jgi:ABC-type oligopeptide transport system substrate-binding subunit
MKRSLKLVVVYMSFITLLSIALSSCGSKKKSITIQEEQKKNINLKTSVDSTVNKKTKIDSVGAKTQDIFEQIFNTEVIVKYDTLGRIVETIHKDFKFNKLTKTSDNNQVNKTTQENIEFTKDTQLKDKSKQETKISEQIKITSGVKLGWVIAAFVFI